MTEYPDRPGYSFDPGPPPEASRFLKNKGIAPAFSWQDVEPEEHAIAFSVAKATDVQVLQTIRDAVQKALDEGQTFESFKKGLRPELERQGWWGKKEMTDPLTGEVVTAQLGSPRRLRTIYRANLRSARAAGQWERIERTSDALPYLEYRLGPSERHRPEHAAKEHIVLPWDDPFWSRWYPPNGWGCKCWVRQISARQAQRTGISESPEVPTVPRVNKRTGEVREVPVGIDPGWDRNPGRARMQAMRDHLAGELTAADSAVAQVALRDIATSWRTARVLEGTAGGRVPVALLPDDIAGEVPTTARLVEIGDEYGTKVAGKDTPVTQQVLVDITEALASGTVGIEVDGERTSLQVYTAGPKPWRAVIKVLPDELLVSTMHRAQPRKWRSAVRRGEVRPLRE